jgi:hypothetical protein
MKARDAGAHVEAPLTLEALERSARPPAGYAQNLSVVNSGLKRSRAAFDDPIRTEELIEARDDMAVARAIKKAFEQRGEFHVAIVEMGVEGIDDPIGHMDRRVVILLEEKRQGKPAAWLDEALRNRRPGDYDLCKIHWSEVTR